MEMILNAALAIVVANLVLGVILWFRLRKLYSYPGLLGFPVFGNLFYFYRTLFIGSAESLRVYFGQLINHGKNGICFHILDFQKILVVYGPQIIKQIGFHPNLKDKPAYAYSNFRSYIHGPFSRHRSDDLWKEMRKEYNYLLRKSRVENNYYNTFLKSADKLVELMFASPSAFDVHTAAIGVTQGVTLETFIGIESSIGFDPRLIRFMHMITEIGSLVIACPRIGGIIMSLFRPIDVIFFRKIGTLRRMFLREIYKYRSSSNQRLAADNTESYYSLLMSIASRNEKSKKFNGRAINEFQELFVTSTHTVSSVMSNTITSLALLPEMQERAWQEQYEIFGDDPREPTFVDLGQMKFLERFIKESLRFYGPSVIAKQASEDIELDGITIPKDTIVVYLLDFMRKDPTYWKDSKVFNPDRFLEENEKLKYIFAPFGIGIRSCPGMIYAMMQLKITLSKILRKTKLSPVNKDLKFEDLEIEAKLLMELKKQPLLQVEERV